jgi:L-lactate dehydrogenase complex protein LldG
MPGKPFDVKDARTVSSSLKTDEKISLLKDRAESSGSNVHIIDGINSLKQTLANIIPADSLAVVRLKDESAGKLHISTDELLPSDCQPISVDELDNKLFDLDAAITDVDLAIAETGSIVLSTTCQYARLVSLVSGIHIALIWPEQIVSDLMDWSNGLRNETTDKLPAALNIISGPSKTADIEIKLIIGVHGPAQLHLIVINEKP